MSSVIMIISVQFLVTYSFIRLDATLDIVYPQGSTSSMISSKLFCSDTSNSVRSLEYRTPCTDPSS